MVSLDDLMTAPGSGVAHARVVKGVYFQWNNEPTNPAVKDWNVTEMRIDRNKRHIDRQIVAEFWRQLDSYKKR